MWDGRLRVIDLQWRLVYVIHEGGEQMCSECGSLVVDSVLP
jgi:hypothetical protein